MSKEEATSVQNLLNDINLLSSLEASLRDGAAEAAKLAELELEVSAFLDEGTADSLKVAERLLESLTADTSSSLAEEEPSLEELKTP